MEVKWFASTCRVMCRDSAGVLRHFSIFGFTIRNFFYTTDHVNWLFEHS